MRLRDFRMPKNVLPKNYDHIRVSWPALSRTVWQTEFLVAHHIQILSNSLNRVNLRTFGHTPEKLLVRHPWSVEHHPIINMSFWIQGNLSSGSGGHRPHLEKLFEKEILNLKHVGIKPV